jgi:hypothetical protein
MDSQYFVNKPVRQKASIHLSRITFLCIPVYCEIISRQKASVHCLCSRFFLRQPVFCEIICTLEGLHHSRCIWGSYEEPVQFEIVCTTEGRRTLDVY